jgi:urease alpha subunit
VSGQPSGSPSLWPRRASAEYLRGRQLEAHGIQFCLYPDGLHESGELEEMIAAIGEGNASVTLAELVRYGPQWGGVGTVAAVSSALFVSQAGHDRGVALPSGTRRQVIPVANCCNLTRDDLWANREAVPIEVDVSDGSVFLDGRILATPPVPTVPLSRRYLLA